MRNLQSYIRRQQGDRDEQTITDGPAVVRAGLEHLATLVPLFDAYRQFYGQASDTDGARAFLSERIREVESAVFLALDSAGETESGVGFIQLYPLFTSRGMKRMWLLNDLFVAPGQRRCGVGRLLMDAARQFAESTGASQLRLSTAKDNFQAKALYQELGYQLDETFDHYTLFL